MTTSVNVKTRGCGATVVVNGETVEMGPNSDRRFDTDETGKELTLSVTQKEPEEPEDTGVPGSAQNDALIEEVDPARLAELSGADNTTAPAGNMTGATEVAAESQPAARRVRTPQQ